MSTGSGPGQRAPIWARPEPATRRPRLSREQIASAALAIADAEGLRAVSMRRVAADLGAGTMSLYRYISTKDDLIALMDDALMGAVLVPADELPADWRAALAMLARRTRSVYLCHPWAVRAQDEAGGAPTGPNRLRHAEQSLAALDTAPFDARGKLDLLAIVDDYVFGHVLRAAPPLAGRGPRPAVTRFVEDQMRSGQFPRLEALAKDQAGAPVTDEGQLGQRFELGLQAMMDGAFRAWAYPGSGIE